MVESGYYYIQSGFVGHWWYDNGSLTQSQVRGGDRYIWYVSKIGNNKYKIKNNQTKRYLCANSDSHNALTLEPQIYADSKFHWYLEHITGEWYGLKNELYTTHLLGLNWNTSSPTGCTWSMVRSNIANCTDLRISFHRVPKTDCVVSGWSNDGRCSKSCGGGKQKQIRQITTQPEYGGNSCPSLSQEIDCNTHPCPVNCAYDWVETGCSKECGGGEITYQLNITRHAAHGGVACPAPSAHPQFPCNIHPCPVDCEVSEWEEWSDCDCQKRRRTRNREIDVDSIGTGEECPSLAEEEECQCPLVEEEFSDMENKNDGTDTSDETHVSSDVDFSEEEDAPMSYEAKKMMAMGAAAILVLLLIIVVVFAYF